MAYIKYTGHGEVQILNWLENNGGEMNAELRHLTGHHVADIRFYLNSDRLALEVNGEGFGSISQAVVALEHELATNFADGASEGGNAYNNVIGHFNAFDNIHVGGITLSDIVRSGDSIPRNTKTKKSAEAMVEENAQKAKRINAELRFMREWQNNPLLKKLRDEMGMDMSEFEEVAVEYFIANPEAQITLKTELF